MDGNKRVAFLAMAGFLRLTGIQIAPPHTEAAAIMVAVAADDVSEESLARRIRNQMP